MSRIKVAIVGVGNCASALLQGIEKYKNFPEDTIGLVDYELGGYKPEDIEVAAAFDIDKRKVGKGLKEAVFAKPNCTSIFYSDLPDYPLKVQMGPVLDGVSDHMKSYKDHQRFIVADEEPCNVVEVLQKSGVEILINYLPVGSEQAAKFYANACLEADVGFINAVPIFIASNNKWSENFKSKGIPIIGDDVKSQMGATVIHRTLVRLFESRGVIVDRSYQLNFGGNTDFLNMLNQERLYTKKKSKTNSVQSALSLPLNEDDIHIGPSDYIPWLNDNKVSHIRIEGRGFGGVPLNLDLKLSVEDSPNSGGVTIDAVRCMRIALDRGVGGILESISSYSMKSPPVQEPDSEAVKKVEEFVSGIRER